MSKTSFTTDTQINTKTIEKLEILKDESYKMLCEDTEKKLGFEM